MALMVPLSLSSRVVHSLLSHSSLLSLSLSLSRALFGADRGTVSAAAGRSCGQGPDGGFYSRGPSGRREEVCLVVVEE